MRRHPSTFSPGPNANIGTKLVHPGGSALVDGEEEAEADGDSGFPCARLKSAAICSSTKMSVADDMFPNWRRMLQLADVCTAPK